MYVMQFAFSYTIKDSLKRKVILNKKLLSIKFIMSLSATRKKMLMSPLHSMFQTFKSPPNITRALGQYKFDSEGNKYLDLLADNLTISVGHSNPRIANVINEQAQKMLHCSTMYNSDPPLELSEKLLATFPKLENGEKWKVQYDTSGTGAVEIALQIARGASGNTQLLSMENSYHGSYGTAMAVSGITSCKHDFPETGLIHHVPAPITKSTPEEYINPSTAFECAKRTINSSTSGKIAGFIFEAVQGYGGIHVIDNKYLQNMEKLTRNHGGYVIADEVQSGLGRMGSCYWSFEMSGVVPDIVTIAKGLGNGMPISAIVAKESVFDKYLENTGKFIFSTYGGNSLATTVAKEVLSIIEDENIQEHSLELGKYIRKVLDAFASKYPYIIKEIRGQGLMFGIEIYHPSVALRIFENMKDNGILVGLGGSNKNVLRFMPPMCLVKDDVVLFSEIFDLNLSYWSHNCSSGRVPIYFR